MEVKKKNVVIAAFTFDGDGMRVKSVINGTTTRFVGAGFEVKNPGTGQEVTKYYFAGASRVAMRKYVMPQSPTVNYMLYDHLGSTNITTDTNGAVVTGLRYRAWGEVRYPTNGTNPGPSKYTYTGQYSNVDDFGLMFYNARWYDPLTGRFAQADTIIPIGVQGLDRYAYVNNSPLVYTDPSGHFPWPLVLVLLFLATVPGDTGPYEVSPLNDAASEVMARFVDPVDWVYTGVECITGQCRGEDVLLGLLPGMSKATRKLADALKIAPDIQKIPGLGTLVDKLNHASDSVRLGAQAELDYLLSHKDEVAEIGKKFGGGLEMDFVLKDGTFVNVKNYDWKRYNKFTLNREIQNMIEQAEKYKQFDPTALKIHFTSKPPQQVIDQLTEAGILVDW